MTPKKCVTIALLEDAHGNVTVCTDLPQPAMGAPLSQAQALGLDLITQCRHRRHEVLHGAQHVPSLALAIDLVSADAYGWQTSAEVSRHALSVLGQSMFTSEATPPIVLSAGAPA